MNHLELLKKLLLALEEETQVYSPIGFLHMRGRLTDDEYEELQRLEGEAMASKYPEVPHD